MERSIGLAFTTLTIFAPLAHAAHPQQNPAGSGMTGGCTVAGELPSGAMALALVGRVRRRRRR